MTATALDPHTAGPARPARAPGAVFSALAVALLVLIATALDPTQPPPPPTAEYAPEAVQAIKDAPPEQVSDAGLGDTGSEAGGAGGGGAGPGATTTTTSRDPAALPPDAPTAPRVRRCIGNPPRQVEDPQSPPCVPYFEGDNGGATWRGVTRDEVRVAVPNRSDETDELERWFNERFELYGRTLKFVYDAGCFGGNPAAAKGLAAKVAKLQVFASTQYCDQGGSEYVYHDELARLGVVSVTGRPTHQTEAHLARFHPYEWSYLPTYEKGSRHVAELMCSLRGGRAEHGGPAVSGQTRRFGLITNSYSDVPNPDLTSFHAALAGCGIELAATEQVQYERAGVGGQQASAESAQQAANAVLRMQQAEVTTLVLLTHATTTRQIYPQLESQGYQPEVLLSTLFYNDEDLFMSAQPQGQAAHTFGVSLWNKFVRIEDEFWYRAITETDPGHEFCCPPLGYFGARYDYHHMLMLVAGIQMAGPNLTPETFASGLQRARWPNPDHPNNPGKVTVSPGNHSFMEDAAVIWWDPTANNPQYGGGQGSFCYVENGRRRRLGQHPSDAGIFRRPCQRF